jgi:large subunit ribosomal protein L1
LKRGKRYIEIAKKIDSQKEYSVDDAIKLAKETASAKFRESIDVAVKLGVDPRKSEQMVRDSIVMPGGTGKEVKILVFAKGEKVKEAEDAGADFVGGEDLIEKIEEGWLDFDSVISTPDMMKDVGKLGKILGPRGLMPTPKTGTVTFEINSAIENIKKGKLDYKVDKSGVVHTSIGTVEMSEDALSENLLALINNILINRPPSAKGQYLQKISVSSTMGPGIKISRQDILTRLGK